MDSSHGIQLYISIAYQTALDFWRVGFATLHREWPGIDRLRCQSFASINLGRIDKYYMMSSDLVLAVLLRVQVFFLPFAHSLTARPWGGLNLWLRTFSPC